MLRAKRKKKQPNIYIATLQKLSRDYRIDYVESLQETSRRDICGDVLESYRDFVTYIVPREFSYRDFFALEYVLSVCDCLESLHNCLYDSTQSLRDTYLVTRVSQLDSY